MGNNRFKYLLENSNPELFIIVTVWSQIGFLV
jgi:hypothetical protein